ncbi:unnamed protein product [Acanthoscelides obtectus]|uniref:Uncharacterized protein n=1 Tax=Acanthoscelides obtectus TaxID=200917 RepID=A0A9P0PZ09_ACAOB|nr:unnamed protein product [Acanthoscelides obtectus]CAK1660487.1 hypothetical protein AOBTE_LOCUS22107 [Acanthoscelides obtectus]
MASHLERTHGTGSLDQTTNTRPHKMDKLESTGSWINQFLTRHDYFSTYTKEMGITQENKCSYCGSIDTPEHTVDFKKAYDTIRRSAVYQARRRLGNSEKIITLIKLTLQETANRIKVKGKYSEKFKSPEEAVEAYTEAILSTPTSDGITALQIGLCECKNVSSLRANT